MLERAVVAVWVCLLAVGCSRPGPAYPPPPQRPVEVFPDPGGLVSFVKMGAPLANEHIVRDIDVYLSDWRWAHAHPQMRFAVPRRRDLKFSAEFAIVDATFQTTGPVTVTCAINGRRIAAWHCDRPGQRRMEAAVPGGWLKPGAEVTVDLVADKLWTAPSDGARLGFLLGSAGFVE